MEEFIVCGTEYRCRRAAQEQRRPGSRKRTAGFYQIKACQKPQVCAAGHASGKTASERIGRLGTVVLDRTCQIQGCQFTLGDRAGECVGGPGLIAQLQCQQAIAQRTSVEVDRETAAQSGSTRVGACQQEFVVCGKRMCAREVAC